MHVFTPSSFSITDQLIDRLKNCFLRFIMRLYFDEMKKWNHLMMKNVKSKSMDYLITTLMGYLTHHGWKSFKRGRVVVCQRRRSLPLFKRGHMISFRYFSFTCRYLFPCWYLFISMSISIYFHIDIYSFPCTN